MHTDKANLSLSIWLCLPGYFYQYIQNHSSVTTVCEVLGYYGNKSVLYTADGMR